MIPIKFVDFRGICMIRMLNVEIGNGEMASHFSDDSVSVVKI